MTIPTDSSRNDWADYSLKLEGVIGGLSADLAAARARIERARKIVELYFAPWGAAKAAEWEYLTGDRPFTPEVALACVRAALAPAPRPLLRLSKSDAVILERLAQGWRPRRVT